MLPAPARGAEGKRVGAVANHGRSIFRPDDGDDVKPRVPAGKLFALNIPMCGTHQKSLFMAGNGGFGCGEFFTGSRANFHKHQILTIQGNNIQLTTRTEHITRQYFHAQFPPEMPGGQGLAAYTQVFSISAAHEPIE